MEEDALLGEASYSSRRGQPNSTYYGVLGKMDNVAYLSLSPALRIMDYVR
jgi:hypothetical protein